MNNKAPMSVTALNRYLKHIFDNDMHLNSVYLKGEISNFKAHTRGHYYFTLKDEESRVNAVMFASSAKNIKFMPQDGMKVVVTGKVSVYTATGGYQIYVNDMLEDGLGNLHVAFEQLKEKLSKEGLFDPKHKKELPKFPERIGIITAETGAAIKDVLSTLERRWPISENILYPSLVQGEFASKDIIKNLLKADLDNLDVIILTRGGGSIEDLWSFNDEELAKTIFNLKTPIISAVGHEIDFTISDFVSDLRAPTPTSAAEQVAPNKVDVLKYIKQLQTRSITNVNNKLNINKKIISNIIESYILQNPKNIYLVKEQLFDNTYEKLLTNIKVILNNKKNIYNKVIDKHILRNPHIIIDAPNNKLVTTIEKLELLNPLITIKRGYSIIRKDNKVISSIKDIKLNDTINLELKDGNINAKVIKEEK